MPVVARTNSILFIAAVVATLMSCTSCSRDGSGPMSRGHSRGADLQKQLEACRRQHASQVSTAAVDALRAELRRYALLADEEARRQAAMQRVMGTYSRGVCLIHGIFTRGLSGPSGNSGAIQLFV